MSKVNWHSLTAHERKQLTLIQQLRWDWSEAMSEGDIRKADGAHKAALKIKNGLSRPARRYSNENRRNGY